MTDTPWKTKDWQTSPWNFAPEVLAELNFPKKIKIHDVTLRDGEQQAGIAYNYDDKIRIAEALAEAGVHRIEAGMPVVSPDDARVVQDLAKRNLGPQIFAFARCMVEDVKRAVDSGVNGVIMEVPSSDHLIKLGYRWELEKAIDLSIKSTQYAHEQGLEVIFFPIDFTRSEINWVIDLIERVGKEGHMDGLALVDTMGATSIHAMRFFVRAVKSRIKVPLEAHFHMDYGLGIANTLMAVAEGVEVIQSTVLGIGERAGNVPMEETVMALKTLYNKDIGIKTEKLKGLADLVRKLTPGLAIPHNRPVVGDDLFKVESGIIATWLINCGVENQTEVFPFRPSMVGQKEPEVVMGKGSGIDSVKFWLQRAQIRADEKQAMDILMAVKDWGLINKRLMNEDEFKRVAETVLKKSS